MQLRSQISLMLVRQGLVRGSKEFKRAYNKELRKKNPEKRREIWKKYYQKKQKETHGEWNRSRISSWRKSNPGDWKMISYRATQNGLHKRFYYNHKEELKRKKAEYGKQKRREDKFFGIKRSIDSKEPAKLRDAIKRLSDIINELD